MKLLVTGAAGFIGSNFVHHLLGEGAARLQELGFEGLVSLDKLTYAGVRANLAAFDADPRHTFVQGDIADVELVSRLLREHTVGAVVNFAAESHVDRSIDTPEPFFETNVIGTLRLLDAVRAYWRALPDGQRERFRYLHISTDEVYGSLEAGEAPCTEDARIAPNSPYAASKAAGDCVVRACHRTYGLPVLITHCANNFGPRQFPEKLIPLMILNALDGKPLPLYGDGRNVRDWIHVRDHCEAVARVLASGRVGERYNIGGHCERSNLEIVDTVCALLDELRPRPGARSYGDLKTFVADRPGHDRRCAIDCSKLRNELGWHPSRTLETGLRETVQWYLDNQPWCEDITRRRYQRQRLGL